MRRAALPGTSDMADAADESLPVPPPASAAALFRPSEYTALLLQALHMRAGWVDGASALEIGTGSGVILSALARLGATRLSGVDIEPIAVERTRSLLQSLGDAPPHAVVQGDMWVPFAGQRFDLIVANLPHFPAARIEQAGRLPSWSTSGADGRWRLDPFLRGLGAHLRNGGRALLVHSGFADLERSRDCLAGSGLSMRPMLTALVQISPERLLALSAAVRSRFEGSCLKQFGSYMFSETHVLEITGPGGPDSADGTQAAVP